MQFIINSNFVPQLKARNQQALLKAGFFIETMLKKALPRDTGDLQKSVTTDLIAPNIVRVGSNTRSAYVAEHGRDPGRMPLLDALVGRSIRKLGLPGSRTQGYSSQPNETKGAIRAIARKIKEKGIAPKHSFSGVRKENEAKARQIYLDALKR